MGQLQAAFGQLQQRWKRCQSGRRRDDSAAVAQTGAVDFDARRIFISKPAVIRQK